MRLFRPSAVALAALLLAAPVAAFDRAGEPMVAPPGGGGVTAAGGAITLDREWSWDAELSAEVAVARGVELAFPLALGVQVLGAGTANGIELGVGVVDMALDEGGAFLFCPAAILAARARLGADAALLAALDFTGAESDFGRGEHPGWIRGAASLSIDMGPWLTVAAGVAFQRRVMGDGAPDGLRRAGWAGDARYSVGSVRSSPFSELPFFAIHALPWLDVAGFVRFDMDTDTHTTDSRFMLGP
ncbi:MAG: hypothetical protein PHU25_16890, partial [Deltaproteobacteria bacterium]|nr:hypothetical protein [Deltaproteobacteria bacterium]